MLTSPSFIQTQNSEEHHKKLHRMEYFNPITSKLFPFRKCFWIQAHSILPQTAFWFGKKKYRIFPLLIFPVKSSC